MFTYIIVVIAVFATAFLMVRVLDLYPFERGVNQSESRSSDLKGQKPKRFAGTSKKDSQRKTAVFYKKAVPNRNAIKTPWGW